MKGWPGGEARKVLADSPNASALLARRCLQQVLRRKLKISPASLAKEVEEARKCPDLTAPTKNAFDHIRLIGNSAAHPDGDPAMQMFDVTGHDAEYTLGVLELLFNDLYVTPARTAAMEARLGAANRAKKK
jgi:hypothetical protein